jgi:aconitate hydratase
VGDPRSFKRPVRVTVPRALPTDDVLVVRKTKSKGKDGQERAPDALAAAGARAWTGASTLELVAGLRTPEKPTALLLSTLDEVRWAADRAATLAPNLRAVIAAYIPSGTVPIFAGLGILALTADGNTLKALAKSTSVELPDPASWNGADAISVSADGNTHGLRWAAVGDERAWTTAGSAQPVAANV